MKLPTSGHSASIARARASNAARSSGAYRIAMFPLPFALPARGKLRTRGSASQRRTSSSRADASAPRGWSAHLARAIAERGDSPTIEIEVAPVELIDKLAILEIKRESIHDAQKLANVETEFAALWSACESGVLASAALLALRATFAISHI